MVRSAGARVTARSCVRAFGLVGGGWRCALGWMDTAGRGKWSLQAGTFSDLVPAPTVRRPSPAVIASKCGLQRGLDLRKRVAAQQHTRRNPDISIKLCNPPKTPILAYHLPAAGHTRSPAAGGPDPRPATGATTVRAYSALPGSTAGADRRGAHAGGRIVATWPPEGLTSGSSTISCPPGPGPPRATPPPNAATAPTTAESPSTNTPAATSSRRPTRIAPPFIHVQPALRRPTSTSPAGHAPQQQLVRFHSDGARNLTLGLDAAEQSAPSYTTCRND